MLNTEIEQFQLESILLAQLPCVVVSFNDSEKLKNSVRGRVLSYVHQPTVWSCLRDIIDNEQILKSTPIIISYASSDLLNQLLEVLTDRGFDQLYSIHCKSEG